MPFKVRCTLRQFMGDVESFPCHFGYEVGDEIIYDGERFIGRICPGILLAMAPVVDVCHKSGNAYGERIAYKYSTPSTRDPSMKKYDGLGFRPLKALPESASAKHLEGLSVEPPAKMAKGAHFVCIDSRVVALFVVEPFDLADVGDSLPYYRREMAILEKLKAKPGLTPEEVLAEFTEWERDEIYPRLSPLNTKLFMDELATVGYIEYRDGKAYPKSSPE
jgi:uncharacterized repeat protein (TIGR04076 family)